jgi:hypothetical protein
MAAAIITADHDETLCDQICTTLEGGAADAGGSADGGTGYVPPYHGNGLDCEVQAEGDMLIADCEFSGGCIGGRRPAGLLASLPAARSEAGAWLARMAWMEDASVVAFEELAHDLSRFGAPRSFSARASRAAIEERRHSRAIGALARVRGAVPAAVRRRPTTQRPLVEIAMENAAEGGVRETYGALVAAHQAAYASDRDVRAVMATIARDEASHALLSDAIDGWARTRIDPSLLDGARSVAARAMRAAVAEDEVTPASARALGLPDAAQRAILIAALA